MPKLSAFTPLGLLKLSAKPSSAELYYRQQIAALGGQFDTSVGTHVEASCYARALAFGRAQRMIEHAGDQAWPSTVLELIPEREREYGLVPGPQDTIADRRRALASARKLLRGAALVQLNDAFRELLGDSFLGVRPTPADEAVRYPDALGDQPMNLQRPTVQRKFVRILESLTSGTSETTSVQYEPLDPNKSAFDESSRLLVGDVLVVDAENSSRTERVTVTGAGTGEVHFTFTATFTKTHAAPFSGTTIPWPLWASSKRHYLIVLTETGAADAETRRKANELAARLFAAVATWSVVAGEESGAGFVAGPFRVEEGMLDMTPIGSISG